MPDVLDLVETATLDTAPPRRLPVFFVPNLIGEYLIERPLRSYFDPYLLLGLVAAVIMAVLRAEISLWLLLLALLLLRASQAIWRIYRDVREDYLLLRYGLVVNAHIMGVRTSRDGNGDLSGAYVDCAIPLTPRRTSVGTVWMPDAAEAARLNRLGRLLVIALPKSPGTWRLRDGDGPHLRYEPAGE